MDYLNSNRISILLYEYIGEFDLPIHKIMYAAANKLLPSIKKLLKNKK